MSFNSLQRHLVSGTLLFCLDHCAKWAYEFEQDHAPNNDRNQDGNERVSML